VVLPPVLGFDIPMPNDRIVSAANFRIFPHSGIILRRIDLLELTVSDVCVNFAT
jgi:hypothetical protein